MPDSDHADVVALFIGPEKRGPMVEVDSVMAHAGRGLEGDRFFRSNPAKRHDNGREATLIELEAIQAVADECGIPFGIGESRRNIVTSGIGLNDLVGKTFRVGDVAMRGVRLCDPCSHLEKMTRKGVFRALDDRGGLRAEILEDGEIRVGDRVEQIEHEAAYSPLRLVSAGA